MNYVQKFDVMLERGNALGKDEAYMQWLKSRIDTYPESLAKTDKAITAKMLARETIMDGDALREEFASQDLNITNAFNSIESTTRQLNAQCAGDLKLPPFYEGSETPTKQQLEKLAQDITNEIYEERNNQELNKAKQTQTETESDGPSI